MTERPGPVGSAAEPAPAVADLALLVPERLALAFGRRRAAWSGVDTAATWLTVIHLIVLLVIVGRGSLYVDDLRAQGYAVQQPFWHFIMGSNGTHFAPLPRVLDWLQSRLFPLEHTPATLVTLAVRLLLAAGFWRVLRRLFGARPATLIPLAVLLFTPALVPATTWYRQSITVLACTVAIVWAIDAQLRWVLYRHWGDLLTLTLVTAAGLACYEKAAAIPAILLGVTLAIFAGRSPAGAAEPAAAAEARTTAAGRERPVRAGLFGVLASTGVVLAFLVIYRSGPYDQGTGSGVSALDVLRLTWDTSTRLVPLLLGGPYHWSFQVKYAGTAEFGQTAIVFCLVLVLLGLAVAVRRGPARTGRALIVLLAWTVPSVAIVAAGRFAQYGLTLADATRLWADLVPAFLLAGALAVLPWRVGVSRSNVVPSNVTRRRIPESAQPGAPLALTVPAIALALVLVVVFGGSMISSFGYASRWWQNPTGQWIANARLSLVNAEPYARMLATPLPEEVMPSWVSVTFPTDAPLLLLLRPDLRFYDGDGTAKVTNAVGVRSSYLPVQLAQAKPAKICVAALPPGTAPVTVPFEKQALYRSGAQVEVGLLLAEPAKVEVSVVTPDGTVIRPERFSDDELPQGPHDLHFPVPYGKAISAVQVQMRSTKISCVSYARVWAPVT
jgi:hypothetical protein